MLFPNTGAYGGGDGGMSQFAGGGFMPSPAGGKADGGGYGTGGQKRDKKQADTMRSLTIRHVLKETQGTEDDPFIVDGFELGTITVVGRILSSQQHAAKGILMLHDGTGAIEVSKWLNESDTDPVGQPSEWHVGRYLRVYGILKSFNGRKSINAYALKRIDDHNEVTHHFLKCVFEQLHLTRGAPPQAGGAPARPQAAATPAYGAAGAYGAAPPTHQGAYGAAPAAAGNDVNSIINTLYNRPDIAQRPQGLSVDEAATMLRSQGQNFTVHQILEAAEFLSGEGHLYSTTDDRTFKTTGSCQ